MSEPVKTWHYGVMAQYWAENLTTGPEIAYYQRLIEQYGQPALDAGCGTGRLLVPFLRAGLDVDGCDVSGDMLAYCRQAAEREGFAPHLYRQALHELDTPRQYQTIVTCGVWGLGGSREQDFVALQRFYDQLLPGGMLLIECYPPYGDAKQWPLWLKEGRAQLPEAWPADLGKAPEDDHTYELHHRMVAIDPYIQQATREMRTLLFQDKQLVADETYTLLSNDYFPQETRLLLEKAGFTIEAVQGDWTDAAATAEHHVVVFFARK